MTNYVLMQPFIQYGTWTELKPGEPPEQWQREQNTAERYSHTAASGRTLRYYVGPRDFISVTFPKQDATLKAEWGTFWQAVRDGSSFYYHESDDMMLFDGTYDFDGTRSFNTDSNGDAITSTQVTLEQDELTPEPDPEVWGYWDVTVNLREYV